MISTDTASPRRDSLRHLLGAPLAAPGSADRRRERAGAWAVHAGVWALTVPVLLHLAALASLHARLTAHLLSGRQSRRVLPVSVLVVASAAFFVRAWLHQL